jgi:hypothetical protein
LAVTQRRREARLQQRLARALVEAVTGGLDHLGFGHRAGRVDRQSQHDAGLSPCRAR